MINKKKIVVVGATSAIAQACLRIWCADSVCELVLIGRNETKLERIKKDLQVRSPNSTVTGLIANFDEPSEIQNLVDSLTEHGAVDLALIAHGSLPEQQVCQSQLDANARALSVNGVSPVLFAEAFAGHMERQNKGTIVLIGSVAGDRGRKSNYVYGAAKGLVDRYAQGLQHRLAKTAVKVVLVKPGPTDTPMTAHLKQTGANLATVEEVAQSIVKGVEKGKAVVYAPGKWAFIMMAIRHLPRFIFNKMDI